MAGVKGVQQTKESMLRKERWFLVRAVHVRGVIEGKRVDERLGNFNSNIGHSLLLLLLLLYLNIHMTGRLKDDCT